ncbi:MAG: hypothetical protein HHJ10_09960 [Cellulomonas sp.]|nr:hypothetical protein [Cellulomonas sp.]
MTGDAGLVVAVDCSTTASKAVVHDSTGRVVAQAARPLHMFQPRASWHEQDAEEWWSATRDAVAEAIAALPDASDVHAVCLTHQRESFVCLGAAGRPLRPAILWARSRGDRFAGHPARARALRQAAGHDAGDLQARLAGAARTRRAPRGRPGR